MKYLLFIFIICICSNTYSQWSVKNDTLFNINNSSYLSIYQNKNAANYDAILISIDTIKVFKERYDKNKNIWIKVDSSNRIEKNYIYKNRNFKKLEFVLSISKEEIKEIDSVNLLIGEKIYNLNFIINESSNYYQLIISDDFLAFYLIDELKKSKEVIFKINDSLNLEFNFINFNTLLGKLII